MKGRMDKWKARASRRYRAEELVGLFFACAALGWMWEVVLRLAFDGLLVNPGTMHGLWLPSYGVGGVLAVVLLRRWADRPLCVMTLGAALCGALELAAGWYLEAVYHQRWWDYSAWPLNADGLVCAPASLVFGLGCCAALYIAAPLIADWMEKRPRSRVRHCCVLLALLFALDLGWSAVRPNAGTGVNDYGTPSQAAGGLTVIEVARAASLLPGALK